MAKKVAATGPVEGPWALPDGWRWERLGAVAQVIAGQSPPSAEVNQQRDGLPFFQGKADFGLERPIARNWCATPTKVAAEGDVLISVRAPVGPTNYAAERCGIGRGLAAIRSTDLSTRYLRYWLMATGRLLREKATGTTFEAITGDVLRHHPVPVPSIGADLAIAARIDELFAEIDDGEAALARARDDLATWRKALLKAAVTGELTADWRAANPATESGADLLERILAERRARWAAEPRNAGKRYKEPPAADATDLPLLPAGWAWASLAQLAFVSGGLTVDAKRKPVDPVELPYMRVANVQRGHLDLRAMKLVTVDRSVVPALALAHGDILLNEGGDRDKIGRGWVYEGQLPVCLHQNHVFKARPVHEAVSPFFVSMYLNELGRRFFIDQGKQTTNLASISLSKVSTAPVPVPPAAEAAEILRVHDEQSSIGAGPEIDDMRNAAANLRQSILAAAFRGEFA